MDVKKVGVLGCGLMGSRIAQITALSGYPVIVRELEDRLYQDGFARVKKSLAGRVEKGKLDQKAADEAFANLKGTTKLDDLKGCDLVIEAVVEDLKIKNEMFAALDKICPPHTIFASNTSSLTIIEMAIASGRPDRVVGLHFFNPAHVMKLVEVVRTIATSQQTFDAAMEFALSLGKVPIAARDDSGFIVNYLLVPYLLDAVRALEKGVGSVQDIDNGMKFGCGYPMGPFTLLDFVGLDTTYRIANIMFDEYRETRYAPPPLLRKMILAGLYGMKSKKGFYDYTGPEPVVNDLGF